MRKILMSAAALALIGLAAPVAASGSGAASGSFGGGFGSVGDELAREQRRVIRHGRSQVRKHITCKQCDYHKRLNKDTALEVARNVLNGRYDIKEKDYEAVVLYLRDRYNL